MHRHVLKLALAAATLFVQAAMAAPHAHQHGAVTLAVAVDGVQLNITMTAPLDSLLGFERAPRSDAERRAAADVLARLRAGGAALFKPDAAARCTLAKAEVQAGVLEPAAKAAPGDGEHADLDAHFSFECTQPAQLRTLDLRGLFDAFKRIRRIDAQVAGPKGQRKARLDRSVPTIEFQR